MRTIKPEELEDLKKHLLEKPFKYEEVYNEVLDHYATAYEESEETLEKLINDLDQKFSNSKIEEINTRYFDDLKRSLRKSHWTIFIGHLRWPQLAFTLILSIALVFISPVFMTNKYFIFSVFLFLSAVPVVMGFYLYIHWAFRKWTRRTKFKNAHAELFGMAIGFCWAYMQIPLFFISKDVSGAFHPLFYHPLLTAMILLLGVLLFSHSMTMMFKKLKPAIL